MSEKKTKDNTEENRWGEWKKIDMRTERKRLGGKAKGETNLWEGR